LTLGNPKSTKGNMQSKFSERRPKTNRVSFYLYLFGHQLNKQGKQIVQYLNIFELLLFAFAHIVEFKSQFAITLNKLQDIKGRISFLITLAPLLIEQFNKKLNFMKTNVEG
jgi:hypothetical protein